MEQRERERETETDRQTDRAKDRQRARARERERERREREIKLLCQTRPTNRLLDKQKAANCVQASCRRTAIISSDLAASTPARGKRLLAVAVFVQLIRPTTGGMLIAFLQFLCQVLLHW